MIPILFEKGTEDFTSGGICRLDDAEKFTVTEVLNGAFTLEMSYPVGGDHFAQIKTERIILAKPNPFDAPQAFIIYEISLPLRGRVTISAEHVAHRQSKITIGAFRANNIAEALEAVKAASANYNPFEITTKLAIKNDITSNMPITLRTALYGRILPLYGGEIKYNNYHAEILDRRGADKGFSIRYGKNLIDLSHDEDISSVYDGIYPFYWSATDENAQGFDYIELPERIVKIGTTAERIKPINFAPELSGKPSEAELRKKAAAYIEGNDINAGEISLDIDLALLSKVEEYKSTMPSDSAELGDAVTVAVPERGIFIRSRIVETVYNGKKDRYDKIVVGKVKKDITDSMNDIKNEIIDLMGSSSANGKIIAQVSATTTRNTAQIELLSKWVKDNEQTVASVAQINTLANANKASINLLTERMTASESATAKISAEVAEQSAKIGLVVETTEDGDTVRGSILVEAINGQSTAKIRADKLDIEGKELNVKVDATNIQGFLTADQIDATGISASNATIWGEIHAESGNIGGCAIENGTLQVEALNIVGTLRPTQIPNLSADKITSGTIDASVIDVINLNAANIAAGSLSVDMISGGETSANITFNGAVILENALINNGNFVAHGEFENGDNYTVWVSFGGLDIAQNISSFGFVAHMTAAHLDFSNGAASLSLGVSDAGFGVASINGGAASIEFSSSGGRLSGTWSGTSAVATTSDETKKHDIATVPERYEAFFDELNPSIYRYNDGTSGRLHTGYTAQGILSALNAAGIPTKDFAGYVTLNTMDKDGKTERFGCLRYEEFIALNTWQIQRLKSRIRALEARLNERGIE